MSLMSNGKKIVLSACMFYFFGPLESVEYNKIDQGMPNECYRYSDSDSCCTPSYTFAVGIKGLYLQPTGGSFNYAAEAVPLPLPSPHWKIQSIDPGFHGGFEVALSGICHKRNSNLVLNWQHLYGKDTARKCVGSQNMIGPFFEIGPDASLYKKGRGKLDIKFDAFDLNYGGFFRICNSWGANLFAGIGGVNIRQTLYSAFSNQNGTVRRIIEVPSSFKGAGPQLGVNSFYKVWPSLYLTGEMKGSLLVGTLKNHTSYRSTSPFLPALGIVPPNRQSTSVKDSTHIVPALKAKLGVAYSCVLCRCYDLEVEAGYQAQIYFNAIQTIDMGSEVNTPPVIPDAVGVFARTFRKTRADFGLSGPYASLVLSF